MIFSAFFYLNYEKNNKFIHNTFELRGYVNEGATLFKMNCVGCYGISARGLVGLDLHSITLLSNDREIRK